MRAVARESKRWMIEVIAGIRAVGVADAGSNVEAEAKSEAEVAVWYGTYVRYAPYKASAEGFATRAVDCQG